jgi:predicted DNA-binding transcriptional regulator AlpA
MSTTIESIKLSGGGKGRKAAWSARETAQRCSISEPFLKKLRLKGEGPPYLMLGRRVLYLPMDVEAWLESRRAK